MSLAAHKSSDASVPSIGSLTEVYTFGYARDVALLYALRVHCTWGMMEYAPAVVSRPERLFSGCCPDTFAESHGAAWACYHNTGKYGQSTLHLIGMSGYGSSGHTASY